MEKECKKKSEIHEIWNGSVFFSHFTRTQSKDSRVTVNTLRRAYTRNAALFTPSAFKGCDLVIPILLTNPRRMSYVLIQVKNDKSLRQNDTQNENALAALSPHEKLDDPECPFLGIWMSLRGKPPSSIFSSRSPEVLSKEIPKKLVVVASGVDATVYPVLREENSLADRTIVEKPRVLLGCTNYLNVADKCKFIQNMYPIDNESL